MRRLILVGVAGLLLAAILGRIVRDRAPRLMETMMEHAMPHMVDRCFGAMSAERREFMLAHCRDMLDLIEQRYPPREVA